MRPFGTSSVGCSERSQGMMRGAVVEFDDPRGIGSIRGDDGNEYAFHCTAIADGTRTIAVGTEVEFDLRPRLGAYEATAITALT